MNYTTIHLEKGGRGMSLFLFRRTDLYTRRGAEKIGLVLRSVSKNLKNARGNLSENAQNLYSAGSG